MQHDKNYFEADLLLEEFIKVAEVSEIQEGKMKAVKIDGEEILIANIEGKYYAMRNRCTHRGGDLSKGTLSGKIVTCPVHGFKFDVTTGKVAYAPYEVKLMRLIKPEPIYEVKVEGEDIMMKKPVNFIT